MSTTELSDRERTALWVIACWFNKPLVYDVLKHKLYPKGVMKQKDLVDRYHQETINRIIELGKWLDEKGLGTTPATTRGKT